MNLYEKKYKEAQGWIEKIYPTLQHEQQMEAESFFPELKESEDEKIRKRIIHALHGDVLDMEETTKAIAWLEKQGEQKSADKIEPKFKVGDWITNGRYTRLIVSINSDWPYYMFKDGTSKRIKDIDEKYHLWAIKDAKDGDVLVAPPIKGQEGKEQIFIFKGINSRDYVDNCIEYYCRICEGVFYENENGYMGTTSSPLYPATKEQRDALFAKMKEAGYEWDTEKKELKKISQRMVSAEAKEALYDKPVWSEEDETKMRAALAFIKSEFPKNGDEEIMEGTIEWLKSLKQRIGWKPSDEQIECLYDAVKHYQTNGYPASKLNELYEQMSKIYKL